MPMSTMVTAFDQFGDHGLTILEDVWLCVPTQKLEWVPTEQKSWSNIKSMFRE